MPDSPLSLLPQGRAMDLLYGIEGGQSKRFNATGVLNVKDFGAFGDNSHDDTASVQLCFDKAFGPWNAPYALVGNLTAIRQVYFPNGTYLVSSNVQANIINVTNDGAGNCLVTVSNTAGFATNDTVYIRGIVANAIGTGVDNLNGTKGIEIVSPGAPGTLKVQRAPGAYMPFSGSYVSGGTIKQPCVRARQTYGVLFGGGTLRTVSPNCALITVDGWSGVVRDMGFDAGQAVGSIAFDYNWVQRAGDQVSSQSSKFYNNFFTASDFGLTLGMGQAMCSETTIQDPFVSAKTGIYVGNQNAVVNRIYGGNFSGCKDYCVWVQAGSIEVFMGLSLQCYGESVLAWYGYINGTTMTVEAFTTIRHPGYMIEVGDILVSQSPGLLDTTKIVSQLTGTPGREGTYQVSNSQTFSVPGSNKVIGIAGKADIYIPNGQDEGILIAGIRSESDRFLWLPVNQPYEITGCTHIGGSVDCFFYHGAGNAKISSCWSRGWINPSSGRLYIENSTFLATDYWRHTEGADPSNPAFVSIIPQETVIEPGTTRSVDGRDGSCRVRFTSNSPITYTAQKTDGGFTRMQKGSWIELQQYGTGQITVVPASGVTVHSANGLKSRAQWSLMRLSVDDAAGNVWTLSGDTAP